MYLASNSRQWARNDFYVSSPLDRSTVKRRNSACEKGFVLEDACSKVETQCFLWN